MIITALGHKIYWDRKTGDHRYQDSHELFDNSDPNLKCVKCKKKRTEEGHDACFANLPGVKYACCGHGMQRAYAAMNDGTIYRGTREKVLKDVFDHLPNLILKNETKR